MKREEPRPRIIIRKVHARGHHGGAWKVAYADFVTTMMALFIVLWILGQSNEVKHAIASYFKDPGAFREGRVMRPMEGGAGVLPGEPPAPAKPDEAESVRDEQALQQAAEQIRALTRPGAPFEAIGDQIAIAVTPEGLRIEIMEREGRPFFEVGSAVLVHPLGPLLEKLTAMVGTLPNHLTIEGHTDGRAYSASRNYSNWELSSDRANAARRTLEASGLPTGRIDRVAGHADRMLLVAGDALDARNRRITILVRRHAG